MIPAALRSIGVTSRTPPEELARVRAERQKHIEALHARQHAEDLIIADYVESSPSSIAEAQAFVSRFLTSPSHTRYHWVLRRWQSLLETKSRHEIAALFREGSPATEELRSSAPFCGPALEAL